MVVTGASENSRTASISILKNSTTASEQKRRQSSAAASIEWSKGSTCFQSVKVCPQNADQYT